MESFNLSCEHFLKFFKEYLDNFKEDGKIEETIYNDYIDRLKYECFDGAAKDFGTKFEEEIPDDLKDFISFID